MANPSSNFGAILGTSSRILLNNKLQWDGSDIGEGAILSSWSSYGDSYYLIYCHPYGHIVCQANRTNSSFPCIIEDIRTLFNLPKRGAHRITIAGYQWIIYYVPLSSDGTMTYWEVPLSSLASVHPLRSDPEFRTEMERLIVFQEVLSLTQTSERNIRLRSGDGHNYQPISYCEGERTVKAGKTLAVLSKAIFARWLGDHCTPTKAAHLLLAHPDPYSEGEWLEFCNVLSNEIERIVTHYDAQFLWLANCIVARLNSLIEVTPDYGVVNSHPHVALTP